MVIITSPLRRHFVRAVVLKCVDVSWRADGEPVKLGGVLADLSDDAAKRAEAMRR